jgi:hypothetical protein
MAPEVKTAKNSKLPKLSENCFEPVGKGGWPPISIWITRMNWKMEGNPLLLKKKNLIFPFAPISSYRLQLMHCLDPCNHVFELLKTIFLEF